MILDMDRSHLLKIALQHKQKRQESNHANEYGCLHDSCTGLVYIFRCCETDRKASILFLMINREIPYGWL